MQDPRVAQLGRSGFLRMTALAGPSAGASGTGGGGRTDHAAQLAALSAELSHAAADLMADADLPPGARLCLVYP